MRVALGGSTIKKITARSGLTTPLHTRKDRSDTIYSSRHANPLNPPYQGDGNGKAQTISKCLLIYRLHHSSRHAARAVICIGVTAYRVCLLLLRYIALNPDPSGRSMLTV